MGELHGCHTQGKTVDQLKVRIKEAILLCLQDGSSNDASLGP